MSVFPLGLSGPTTLYLALYVLSLVAHVVFMNYTLAGTVLLGAETLRGRAAGPVAATLREWLTVALSMAITAGVAPLLFVQILYREGFYTANLLLGVRWMLVLPVLIVGFYLLYAAKTPRVRTRPGLGVAVSIAAVLCFVFVGYSFTENHLLSQTPEAWTSFYGSGSPAWFSPAILPRYAMFALGAIPTMTLLLAWQLRAEPSVHKRLSWIGVAGLVASAAALGGWIATLSPSAHAAIFGAPGGPWLGIAVVGGLVQAAVWALGTRSTWTRGRLSVASVGLAMTLLGMTCVREVVRLADVDIAALSQAHARSSESGGVAVFFLFLVVNGALIAWALLQVRKVRPAP